MAGQVIVSDHPHAEGVVAVTLSNPVRLNAMTRAMWRALRDVFTALQTRTGVRCVIVRGEGAAFCAGGDIAEYPEFRFSPDSLRAFHEDDVWGGLAAMLDCDVPLVAQIEGACMGAGVEIASCCDLRVAGASSKFGAPIARLGFPMAPREAWLVRNAAGDATAREMLLSAAVLDAPRMQSRGFVQQVVADAQVATHALDIAKSIAGLAPQAARLNKQALRALRGPCPPSDAQAYGYADSREHREGIAAFIDKRKPVF
ncbi:enoyl-CoA hydratase/isomerase family protein [Variovorax sp. VNK109]|uniref:enoyl-CoA hydratase/isomerase family protein n=1 Tax=Variovorax sp. VNK109 TaxID=3400919 RepID=UPI003C0B664E